MSDFLYKDLTQTIIGAAFKIYKILGYGFLEKVYENALIVELKSKGIDLKNQYPIDVYYKEQNVGNYLADILAEEKVIIELKAEKEYNPKHESQLLNYLKATHIKVGLLINFGESKCQFKRLIF